MQKSLIIIIIVTVFLQAQPALEKQVRCGHYKSLLKSLEYSGSMTVNQEKTDALYYSLSIDIEPTLQNIEGTVSGTFRILDSTVNALELDFSSTMSVLGVTLNGLDAPYTHLNNILDIPISWPASAGDTLSFSVDYSGNPNSTGFGSFVFDIHDGQQHVWTLSEPYGARDWWPCKDDPSDKADSVDIIVTVPSHLTVASNGNLVDTLEYSGKKTFHWQERYPIATYLVSLAIYPYQVFHDQYVSASNDTMSLDYYVFPGSYESLYTNYMMTSEMITCFASVFGEYPFIEEKYGHAQFTWGGGMEHQTLSSMGGWSESLIAHELAHQWWGDMITCASFHHIWLNEGFATYAEALWYEYKYGTDAYHNDMDQNKYYGDGSIYVDTPVSVGVIFNGNLSYKKSAYVLHMLRNVVGDSLFFEVLLAYADSPDLKYNSVTTEQFTGLCESVTGMELDYFFQQWIYGTYFPYYSVNWHQDSTELVLQVSQTSYGDTFFRMPIDMEVTCSDTTFITRINNTVNNEEFTVQVPEGSQVTDVVLDPGGWILKYVSYENNFVNPSIPFDFTLGQPYPNPFNAQVAIPFTSQIRGSVEFSIYNVRGKEIWRHNKIYEPGNYEIRWSGTDITGNKAPSGIYFLTSDVAAARQVRKILHIK